MAVISTYIQSSNRCIVPWTVFQCAPEDSFLTLFNKIKSGAVPVISQASVSELAESQLERVYVGS